MQKIFFIDDNQNLCLVWKMLFERHGYDIEVFTSAEEVYARIEQNVIPDVVITDYNLPDDNGLVLLTRLLEKCPAIVPIILTGDKESLADSNEVPKNIILLSKPIQFDRIREIISNASTDPGQEIAL